MDSDYVSHEESGTWTLVPRPNGVNVVSCKWAYKMKEEPKPNGTLVTCRKPRLIAREFSQFEGVDYSETYAPGVKFTLARILLALVVIFDLELHQMDVVTALVNAGLKEVIHMEKPQGYERAVIRPRSCPV